MERLFELGILQEMAEKNRGRMYCAPKILDVLRRKNGNWWRYPQTLLGEYQKLTDFAESVNKSAIH